jgi:F-type H+-transporting ATPase subunit alpha
MAVLGKGARNVEVLKQAQNSPMSVEKQVAIIYLGTKGLLNKVPVDRVREFEEEFLGFMDTKHRDVLDSLKAGKLTDEITAVLEKVGAELSSKY